MVVLKYEKDVVLKIEFGAINHEGEISYKIKSNLQIDIYPSVTKMK